MKTEDEARKCWCPFARNNDSHYQCIASECMAWRWLGSESQEAVIECARKGDHEPPLGDGWEYMDDEFERGNYTEYHTYRRKNPTRKGFCGLAGKP